MVYNKFRITSFLEKESAKDMENATKKPYYITTAIAYTSGKPHIGNTYEAVLADAIARFKRKEGYDVFFQTGTDEHGQKIEDKAKAAGVTPKQYVDKVAGEIKGIWDLMNTSYDKFIRTTDEAHEAQVAKIFKKFYDRGDIYKGYYEGMYCTPCESFWTESQLIDGKCPDCGREVKPAKEEAYFFKMGKYADRLIKHIDAHPEFIQPVSRKNEMMNNFLLKGLQDLCVSRTSFTWGIPVEFDKKHVVYVWLDALSNYITGLGYDADGASGELYKKYWPADLHLIGKDIIRFHTIYWPIFLMALGEPLPKQIFGHPWLLQGEGKMSKSKGNVIYADDLARLFGVDAVRFFVLHEMPFDNDGQISWELVAERYNSELANVLGNLVSRTVAMIVKYFGGAVEKGLAAEEAPDAEFKETIAGVAAKVRAKADSLHIADAITEIFTLFRRANKYIDETMPWALAKDESKKARLATVMYNLLEAVRICTTLLLPVTPEACQKIFAQIGADASVTTWDAAAAWGVLPANVTVHKGEAIFPRIDAEKALAELEEIEAAQKKAALPALEIEPLTEEKVDFDTFCKSDFRAVKVKACEAVKKSDKLLKFTLDDGTGTDRQILSGIHKWYEPEQLIGKTLLAIVNLPPRKMMGQESCGMLISAVHTEHGEEQLHLVILDDAIPAGAKMC